jgi:hypothetical protein
MVRASFGATLITAAACLGGCGTHSMITPGRGAQMSLFCGPDTELDRLTDPSVRHELVKQPLATFPAGLAVVRVQEPGYRNRQLSGYGSGAYSVVTTQDVETPADFDRLQKLPLVKSVSPLNRLLLPENLHDGEDLRRAAASLGADLLLVYTFDTTITSDDWAPPLAIITLGLFPTYTVDVDTTASMALLDVRNGFVYGTGQASSKKSGISNAWTDDSAAESMRRKAEREALNGLLNDLEKNWSRVALGNASPRESWPRSIADGNNWGRIQQRPVTPEGQPYRTAPAR